jgi:two-component system, OmpR family, phosphate regulon response regulator OmpR
MNQNQNKPNRVVVVDDDPKLRELLNRYLTEQGMDVVLAADGPALNKLLLKEPFSLIILDLMLPGEDGLSIMRRLRGANDPTPIILLTAKGEDIDRIIGLEMGADDYLAKPFNPRELLARINAVLRRKPADQAASTPETGSVEFGPFKLDLATRILTKDGAPMTLTTGEYALLKILVRHAGQPLSREKLMILARGREYDSFDRSLDVQVSRLRKLLEADPANPRYLQTVWGVGYVFLTNGAHAAS